MDCPEHKVKIPTDASLSFTSLEYAISFLINEFGFKPKMLLVNFSIEDIMPAVIIQSYYSSWPKKWLKKLLTGIDLYFYCKREFKPDYWEISYFEEGVKYIVYTEGA